MAQFYSDPSRENDTTALPDAEVFHVCNDDLRINAVYPENALVTKPGWYYWFCFPGCLPDSEPIGPFESEQAAIDDCQEKCF